MPLPLIYTAAQAYEMIVESAREFRVTPANHLADVLAQLQRDDWTGEGSNASIIDLESMIWDLNKRHGRADDSFWSSSNIERAAFRKVISIL